ncbi:MAG TPA: FAD-dependent oxidoreductase, partial [Acidimicrobiales bacterium]|nr:FAD-dependent oxidoreductase [Acidimicrobiales bacterium]
MSEALPRVLILGGGIAGLAAAWECHRQGVPSIVLEAQPHAGCVIRTEVAGPFVLDTGPDAFLATKRGAIDLCRELGIDTELIAMTPPRG